MLRLCLGFDILKEVTALKDKLRGWNINVFGNIFFKKRRLLERLNGIHKNLLKLERKLIFELN